MTDNPYKAPQSDVSTSPPAKSIRERLEERYGNEKDNAAKGMEFLALLKFKWVDGHAG